MTPDDFVESITTHVRDAAAADVISVLTAPPGRSPAKMLSDLSRWFLALSDEDRVRVEQLVRLTSHYATFGMLTVLDGARPMEGLAEGDKLELRYISGSKHEVLNDPEGDGLHHKLPALD